MKTWRRRVLLFLVSQAVTLFGSTLVQMAVVWHVTLFGSTLVQMAVVWHVTLETTSGAWVAAFTAASYLPQFLVSFVGGAWADRYDRKRLIIGADALIAAVTLAMWFLLAGIEKQAHIRGLLLGMSVLRSLGAACRRRRSMRRCRGWCRKISSCATMALTRRCNP